MIVPRLRLRRSLPLVVAATLLAHGVAYAANAAHVPDIMPLLLLLTIVLIGAKLGGAAVALIGQPAVLGELLVGVVLGNLGLVGFHGLDFMRGIASVDVLAEIGVLFLLFTAGLEADVGEMAAVGWSSLLVAVIGVIAPIGLGFLSSAWFFPDHHPLTHWFVGAALCATSVGITARVLADLGRTTSPEGRIVLGAAVVDDVLGLIMLAVVTGVVKAADQGQPFAPVTVLWIAAKALGFLTGALLIGRWISRRAFQAATRLRGDGILLTGALAFCFGLSYLAAAAGLAPIVGAFAAGLILDEVHYRSLIGRDRARRTLPQLLDPLATFLVPVFFVLMGTRVDLTVFTAPGVIGFAALLTLVAVVSKQACALGVLERGADRFAIGLGMIPRGEVGLIFASIGTTLSIAGERVVDDAVFSAVVVMATVTTLVTPPLLAWRLRRLARVAVAVATGAVTDEEADS